MTTAESLKTLFDGSSLTLAVAESASGGHLSSILTSVSGSSTYFRGGVIAYHIDVKVDLLGVTREHAAAVNCVSAQVAKEMATGVRRLLKTDVGVSITGYAEPWGIAETYAWIGFDVKGEVWAEQVKGVGDRVGVQTQFADLAATGLLNHLLGKVCR